MNENVRSFLVIAVSGVSDFRVFGKQKRKLNLFVSV